MNANELRIGNWIADRGSKQWQIDHWETKDKISAKSPLVKFGELEIEGHPLTEEVLFLKPIPITEEWLVRFGFKSQDLSSEFFTQFNKGIVSIVFRNKSILIVCVGTQRVDHNNFKYVHQLQNLYFALTGEELILTIP